MITRSETSLSAGEYSNLAAASEDVSASIKLQRLGPVWTDPGHTDASANTALKAMLFDGQLVRVFLSDDAGTLAAEKLADETGSTQDWMSVGVSSNVSINGAIQLDLVTDDTTLRAFYLNDDDKIAYSDCTDLSVGFGEPTAIEPAITGLSHLAAPTLTTVHYITLTSKNNRRFHVGTYSNTWSHLDSDILYPFPVDSMSAIQMDDGTDVLALAATLPPLIGNRVVGTKVSRSVEAVQGILTFLYDNNRWSDHYTVDVIDNIPSLPGRSDIRLSYYNSIIFATYMRKGGGDIVNYSKCAVSRSVTGKFFEFPELIDLDTPAVLVPRDDYLYLVGESTLRSPCCEFAGQTPVEQDITGYITNASSSAGDIRQTSYSMANPAQSDSSLELDDTLSDLAATERMQAVYELGYWIDGNSLTTQVGIEDIVTVGKSSRLPVNNISLMGMDKLSRLNRISSDFAAEYPGMEIGRDPFNDPTGTGWGGMRHLASYKPSWKAEDGILNLVSNNKEGLVVSTFVVDTLNGTIQAGISPGYDNQNEYAGIAFRVYDKDTLYYLAYHPDEDQVRLYQRQGSGNDDGYTDTLVDYVDTSGWGWSVQSGVYFYLRAWAYYGRLYLHKSTDGITWSVVSWNGSSQTYTELSGQPGHSTQYSMWSGKFGLIGYGYSNEETTGGGWPGPSPWVPPSVPSTTAAFLISYKQIAVAFDIKGAVVVTWYDADPNDNLVGDIINVVAVGKEAYVATNGDAATTGLWYCDDVTAAIDGTLVWTLVESEDGSVSTATTSSFTAQHNYGSMMRIGDVFHIGEVAGSNPRILIGSGDTLVRSEFCDVYDIDLFSSPPKLCGDDTAVISVCSIGFSYFSENVVEYHIRGCPTNGRIPIALYVGGGAAGVGNAGNRWEGDGGTNISWLGYGSTGYTPCWESRAGACMEAFGVNGTGAALEAFDEVTLRSTGNHVDVNMVAGVKILLDEADLADDGPFTLSDNLYSVGRQGEEITEYAGSAFSKGAIGQISDCECESVQLSEYGLESYSNGWYLDSNGDIFDEVPAETASGVYTTPAYSGALVFAGIKGLSGIYYVNSDYYLCHSGIVLTDGSEFDEYDGLTGRGGRFAFSDDESFLVRTLYGNGPSALDRWPIEHYNIVVLSEDSGTTWVDRTGNLATAISDTDWYNEQQIVLFEVPDE